VFISLKSHREVVAAKDETISLLKDQVVKLRELLSLQLGARRPAPAAPGRMIEGQESSRKRIDYSLYDENNMEELARLAKEALRGRRQFTPADLKATVSGIRQQIIAEKEEKLREEAMTMAAKTATHPPKSVMDRIERAARGEEDGASGGE
jgi:hypothetical protein